MTFRSELRQMLKLAAEAAKVEIDRWRKSAAETSGADGARNTIANTTPARGPEEAGTSSTPSPWRSSTYHVEALRSATCPDCGGAKKVGAYRCADCHAKAVAA